MTPFDPASYFGPTVAAHYDDQPCGDEEAAATFLADLAQGRPTLEFAIGTGRIALVLAAKGLPVNPKSALTNLHVYSKIILYRLKTPNGVVLREP